MNSLVKVTRSGVRIPIILNNVTPQYESIRGWRRPLSTGGSTDPPDGTRYYDFRKYSHCLPANNTFLPFERFGGIPNGVFRDTTGERIGPGADKMGAYKQAEYFSFHHSTFFDMHLLLQGCRQPQIDLKRKPLTF